MGANGALSWQPSLLDAGTPAIDESFARAERLRLDARSWVDVVPGWVAGADQLFAELLDVAGWQLVTGGRCQREWDHSIPNIASAGPRMSITFRHSLPPTG